MSNASFFLFIGVVCWALWSLAMKKVTGVFPPMAGVAAIWAVYGVGAVSFWMFEIITTGSSSVSQTTPKQWAIAASAAIPAMIGTGMFLLGLHHGAKVATATAISSVYPALTAVLAWYFLSESLSVRELAGIAMIIGGVLLFQ